MIKQIPPLDNFTVKRREGSSEGDYFQPALSISITASLLFLPRLDRFKVDTFELTIIALFFVILATLLTLFPLYVNLYIFIDHPGLLFLSVLK